MPLHPDCVHAVSPPSVQTSVFEYYHIDHPDLLPLKTTTTLHPALDFQVSGSDGASTFGEDSALRNGDQSRNEHSRGRLAARVLMVSSSKRRRQQLEDLLSTEDYSLTHASTGREALRILRLTNDFRLVLICEVHDLLSSTICKRAREWATFSSTASIVILSESFDVDQATDCLANGASDYISGPHLRESRMLLARIRVAVRGYHMAKGTTTGESLEPVTIGRVTIDPTRFRVTVRGEGDITLTTLQFRLLYRLARRAGRVFRHDELCQVIAEYGGNPDERTVKSHMSNLRRRLGDAAPIIKTIRGVGYVVQS